MENLNKVEESSVQVNEMVNVILGDSLNELDSYMENVRNAFIKNQEILDDDLNKIILRIPTYIYNLIVLAQQIEMKKGLTKEDAKYAYNEALLNATGKTVGDKAAQAENQTVQHRITQMAYTTAASIVSKKMEGAMAILDSARKVQAARSKEKALTGMASNAVGAF